jgi:hypothetical protein
MYHHPLGLHISYPLGNGHSPYVRIYKSSPAVSAVLCNWLMYRNWLFAKRAIVRHIIQTIVRITLFCITRGFRAFRTLGCFHAASLCSEFRDQG